MDINIDGKVSTYNKDDSRGIRVGHSVYFADSYDDLINKYTDGHTVEPDPEPEPEVDYSPLVGVISYDYKVYSESGVIDSSESFSYDWSTSKLIKNGYEYSVEFIENDVTPLPANYTYTSSDGLKKVDVTSRRIKAIKMVKDSSKNDTAKNRLYSYYLGEYNLADYYTKNPRPNLGMEIGITLSPTTDYAYVEYNAYGMLGQYGGKGEESRTRFYCETYVKGITKYVVRDYKNGYASDASPIDLTNSNIQLCFFEPEGYTNTFYIRDTLPEASEVTCKIRTYTDAEMSAMRKEQLPENIGIDNELVANIILSTNIDNYEPYTISSENCYNFVTGVGGRSSYNPYYSENIGDFVYPSGVKMTLNMDKYTGYSDTALATNTRYFNMNAVAIRGMHFILNGVVDYSNDENLQNNYTNYYNPTAYNLLGYPDSDYPIQYSYYDGSFVLEVKAGHGLIIYIDDAAGIQNGTNLFDIHVYLFKEMTSYEGIDYNSLVIVQAVYDSSKPYIYIPYKSLCTNSEFQAYDNNATIYVTNISLGFGYDSSGFVPTGADLYVSNTNRKGLVFNNFKFSIYSGPDPSTVSTQSLVTNTQIMLSNSNDQIATFADEEEEPRFNNLLDSGCYNTWDDFHLIPTSRPVVAPASVKVKTVDIPGGNGVIDLSNAITKFPLYENRTGSLEFIVDPDQDTWVNVYQKISNYLNGRFRYMALEDDPYWVYEGKFIVNEWTSDKRYSTITIDYDVKPYKRYILASNPDISYSTGRDKIPGYRELKKAFMGVGVLKTPSRKIDIDLYSTIPVVPTFKVHYGTVHIQIRREANNILVRDDIYGMSVNTSIVKDYESEEPQQGFDTTTVRDLSLMFQGSCRLEMWANEYSGAIPEVDIIFRPGIL